ncbi:MAG: cation:proton antiporter [Campylobacterota bacterium]|nr:cation:proton antiporter [Campylobacterota bacterium]
MNLLAIIVITLAISLSLNLLLKRFHVSPIVGYILTGALITIGFDFINIDQHILGEIAEFGIVFLMFTIGLEFSLHHLKSMKKEVFVYGTLQMFLSAAFFGFVSNTFFGIDTKTSIIIGTALALSSTAIVLKVLNENGDIHRPYGRYSLGILLFQDLAVIPILLMISFFANPTASISNMLLDTLYSGIIVLFVMFIFGKYLLGYFFKLVTDSKTEELFIAAVLLIVLSSALLAHAFGFSYSLGAFFAGMMIAETKYKYQIEADLVPFRDLLLGLFFISVGMQINMDIVLDNFVSIILLTIGILLCKAVIIFAFVTIFSFAKRAMKTALALAQVGEFSFAVLALASSSNLLDDQINQILIAVVVVSLIFTSLAIRYVRAFTNIFFKHNSEIMHDPIVSTQFNHHVIVCGYSLLGQKIVKQLTKKGLSYVAIDQERQHVQEGLDNHASVMFGNAASKHVLESVGVKDCIAVIVAIDNDEKVRLICESIKSINKDIPIVVKISHKEQIEDLEDLEIKEYINENESVAKLLVSKAMKCDLKH